MSKIVWTYGSFLSPLRAAAALARDGRLADQRLQAAIAEPVNAMIDRLEMAEVEGPQFWSALLQAGYDSPADAVRVTEALTRAHCPELTVDTVAAFLQRRITDVRGAMNELYPRLEEQLPLRGRPLRDQWETCGPGLMRMVGKLSHPDLLPSRATLVLVHPAGGGGAAAVPDQRWGWIEAVLTNVVPKLPETVRVAWVLASIGIAHPDANRLVAPHRLMQVGTVASVPIALSAAAELDLIDDPLSMINTALSAWRVEADPEIVQRWWKQQLDGAVPFAVGLRALERMLETP